MNLSNSNARASSFLLLICVIAGLAAERRSNAQNAAPQGNSRPQPRQVKCGRDSIHMVCLQLGISADLHAIDSELGRRDIVSFADLRKVLESKGLQCHSVILEQGSASGLAATLNDPQHPRCAVAAIGTPDPQIMHFVAVVDASADQLLLQEDISLNPIPYDIAMAREGGIPLMLVGRDETVHTAFETELWSIKSVLFDASSSLLLTLVLAAAAATLIISWCLSCRLSARLLAAAASLVSAVAGGIKSGMQTHRVAFRYGAGAVLLLGTMRFLALRELYPLTVATNELELGARAVGSSGNAEIRVINRSLFRSMPLGTVNGSCSCIDIKVENSMIPPGGFATIQVGFMVTAKGLSQHSILIASKDEAQKMTVRLSLHGYDDAKLVPASFNLGDFPQGVSIEKRFSLTSVNFKSGQPLTLKVNAPSSGVKPFLDVAVAEPAGDLLGRPIQHQAVIDRVLDARLVKLLDQGTLAATRSR